MPRGVPQSMYTELADKVAETTAAENKELLKKLEAEKLVAPKSNEEELPDAEGETAEAIQTNESMDEMSYPPVAMEDQTSRVSIFRFFKFFFMFCEEFLQYPTSIIKR